MSIPDSGERDRRAEVVFVPAARSLRLGTVEREGRVDCSAAEERTSAEGLNGFFWNEETIVKIRTRSFYPCFQLFDNPEPPFPLVLSKP